MPVTSGDGSIELVDLIEGSGRAFDPDPSEQAITGEYGICVDVDSSYNQGCPDQTLAGIVDGVVGCFDSQISMFFCGLELDIADGDVSTASLKGNFLYPRVLVAAGEDLNGDGQSSPRIECTDPIDCKSKCAFLERTSLHGAGAPPTCAICDLPCSNNVLTTITSLVDAIWSDILTVVRLVSVCFGKLGLSGCVCQLVVRGLVCLTHGLESCVNLLGLVLCDADHAATPLAQGEHEQTSALRGWGPIPAPNATNHRFNSRYRAGLHQLHADRPSQQNFQRNPHTLASKLESVPVL